MNRRPFPRSLALGLAFGLGVTLASTPAAAQYPPGGPGGGTGAARPGAPAGGQYLGSSEIGLAIGEQYVIPSQNIRQYSVGTDGIVDVRVPQDGSRMLVVGQRQGTTTLLVIRNDGSQQTYSISVFRLPIEVVRQQLVQLLSAYNNVSINQVGGRLFLEGGVASESQLRRVGQIAAIYQGQVESLVAIDPTVVERRINVRVDLYFVELSRNSSMTFGLGWGGSIGGGTVSVIPQVSLPIAPSGPATAALDFTVQGAPGSGGTGVTQPLPRLDFLQNAGWARVHRHATIVTGNGTEAVYTAGGEYNILPAATGGGAVMISAGTVQRINYGSEITVTPRFDPTTGRVDMRVQANLSDLVDTGAGVPGRSTAVINTLVNLQLGQSIVLSGLRARSYQSGGSGIPILSQLPVIGTLFGTQTRRENDREMVIFVVPTVIEGVSRQSEDRIANALRAYEQFGGWLPDGAASNIRPPVSQPAGLPPGATEGSSTPTQSTGGR